MRKLVRILNGSAHGSRSGVPRSQPCPLRRVRGCKATYSFCSRTKRRNAERKQHNAQEFGFFPAADIFQMFSGLVAEQRVKTAVSLAGLFRFAEFRETFAFKNFGGNMLLAGLLQFLRFGFGMLAGFLYNRKAFFISSFGGVSISNSAARVSSRQVSSAMSAAFR